jgi:hypothetical protein
MSGMKDFWVQVIERDPRFQLNSKSILREEFTEMNSQRPMHGSMGVPIYVYDMSSVHPRKNFVLAWKLNVDRILHLSISRDIE